MIHKYPQDSIPGRINKVKMDALKASRNENLNRDIYELCLQDECAVNADVDYIVTCNVKDFKQAKTPVVTPDIFLKIIAETYSEENK